MRQLVECLRAALTARAKVDQAAIEDLKAIVSDAVPRLQGASLTASLRALKPGRYLCYKDPDFQFVVMILVWGKGDGTPIHDHGTWGVEAVLHNALRVTSYTECEHDPRPLGTCVCESGTVLCNLPPDRDVHKVEHHSGECAVSLHIYGREMTGNRMFVPGEGFKSCKLETRTLETAFDLTHLKGGMKCALNT